MFIDNIINHIFENYNNNIHDICIVVPNLRPKIHISNSLKQRLKEQQKAAILPQMLSSVEFITELASTITPLHIVDNTSLMLHFYEVVKKETNIDFPNFILWAPATLKDFNELDLYMADVKSAYSNLSDEKAIDLWSPENKNLSQSQENYIRFLDSLSNHYLNFKEYLFANNMAYSGMAYRFVAENIETIAETIKTKWKRVILAGFNALSKSEIAIFDCLYNKGIAEILWDADKYYLDDNTQEAGLFLRRNIELWPKTKSNSNISDEFSEEKRIELIEAPGNIQQAEIAGKILCNNQEKFTTTNTTIVLADEKLLVPVLDNIPDTIKNVNITMEISSEQNPVYMLFINIINMQANAVNNTNQEENTENNQYYKLRYVNNIIHNNCFANTTNKLNINIQQIYNICSSQYIKPEYLYINDENRTPLSNNADGINFLTNIFKPFNNTENCITSLNAIADVLLKYYSKEEYKIEYEVANSIKLILNDLGNKIENFEFLKSFENFTKISTLLLKDTHVTLKGEPLTGLQVQGILETRLLDYENIILLSASDDNLPKPEKNSSLLTYTISSFLKLPSIYEKNAVYAYHFYRLIQRAKNIFIIYCATSSDIGTKESSRYIKQIQLELPNYSKNVAILQKNYSDTVQQSKKERIKIEKTDKVTDIINNYLTNIGLSASGLNDYLSCPLKFYYNTLLKISDETFQDTIDAKTFGNIIHDSLNNLYKKYLNKPLNNNDFDNIKSQIDNTIEESLTKNNIDITNGKNYIILQIIKEYVKNQIYNDSKKTDLTILKTEDTVKALLNITLANGQEKEILLKGIIDRIENLNGNTRILDYKTGSIDAQKLSLSYFQSFKPVEKDNPKIVQLLFYALLFFHNNKAINYIDAGLYPLRYANSEKKEMLITETLDRTIIDGFIESILQPAIAEILDESRPFEQCEDNKNCTYCNFREFCNI